MRERFLVTCNHHSYNIKFILTPRKACGNCDQRGNLEPADEPSARRTVQRDPCHLSSAERDG